MRSVVPPDRQRLGREAEDAAAVFLEQQHLTILARNYRCRSGELDIIALTPAGVLVIAEVRLRADARYGGAAASVDWRKQRRIQRAAHHLLARRPALARHAIRFDVLDLAPGDALAQVGDVAAGREAFRIRWIQHAFEAVSR